MRFSTTKDVLLKGIQVVQSGISSKSSLPILANMLIDATGENVIFTTTDLDIGIISTTLIKPAVVGGVTIPTKKFFDVIKELPDIEAVTISAKKNNTIHIECGTNMFKVMGLPKEEFPQLPEFKNKEFVPVHQKKLKEMLTLTSFAVSNDETRYVLNGVLFVIKPGYVRLVATDGRRLAVVEYKTQLPKSLERKMIVPAKAITELGKILGDEGEVKIFFSDNQALFDAGQTRLVSRLVEGDFPNYEQVIPKETKDKVFVGREKFLAAIKRVAVFTNQDSMAIKLEVGRDKLVLSKTNPYLGEARVEVDAEYKGKEMSVGFNPGYLIDFLKNIKEEKVAFELTDSEKPGVVRVGEECIYVVLPMQVG